MSLGQCPFDASLIAAKPEIPLPTSPRHRVDLLVLASPVQNIDRASFNNARIREQRVYPPPSIPNSLKHLRLIVVICNVTSEEIRIRSEFFDQLFARCDLEVRACHLPALRDEGSRKPLAHPGLR